MLTPDEKSELTQLRQRFPYGSYEGPKFGLWRKMAYAPGMTSEEEAEAIAEIDRKELEFLRKKAKSE